MRLGPHRGLEKNFSSRIWEMMFEIIQQSEAIYVIYILFVTVNCIFLHHLWLFLFHFMLFNFTFTLHSSS